VRRRWEGDERSGVLLLQPTFRPIDLRSLSAAMPKAIEGGEAAGSVHSSRPSPFLGHRLRAKLTSPSRWPPEGGGPSCKCARTLHQPRRCLMRRRRHQARPAAINPPPQVHRHRASRGSTGRPPGPLSGSLSLSHVLGIHRAVFTGRRLPR